MMNIENIDFEKGDGLVPAIVQDSKTRRVLMLGYMNRDSMKKTIDTGKVTFFSRRRKLLWTKGESSGNYLFFENSRMDCDGDTLLVSVRPAGPVCHTGRDTCFGQSNGPNLFFLDKLEQIIKRRKKNPKMNSYTSSLFGSGTGRISKKVGEEAVELILEAVLDNRERFLEEAADLLFHYMVLLTDREQGLADVCEILESRRTEL